jgi:hypothetical protein
MCHADHQRCSRSWPRRRRSALGAAALAIATVLAGCASGTRQAAAPHRADTWEAVFLPPDTAGALAPMASEDLPGFDRNDSILTARVAEPLMASSQWPEARRDSIERTRTITISSSTNSFLFFVPERRDGRHRRAW